MNRLDRMAELERELAEWRAGKRRVFWRVVSVTPDSLYKTSCRAHKGARQFCRDLVKLEASRGTTVSVRRVTVGPAKPKEAK